MEINGGVLCLRSGKEDAHKPIRVLTPQQDAIAAQADPPDICHRVEAGVQFSQIWLEKLCCFGPYGLTGQFRILRQSGCGAYDHQISSLHRVLLNIHPAAGRWLPICLPQWWSRISCRPACDRRRAAVRRSELPGRLTASPLSPHHPNHHGNDGWRQYSAPSG